MILCGQEFTEETIARIQKTVDEESGISRTALSRRICEWLDWRRPNGGWKEMSCRVALLKMARRGAVQLPPAQARPPGRLASMNGSREFEPVRSSLGEVGPIELIQIKSTHSAGARLWDDLMNRYHYLKGGPLCGAQMRYLIKSGRGWLGGFAFSSAAWRVGGRDQWIGWDDRTRAANLERVVCNSRFLILPWVEVPHLASHVLAMSVKRLKHDWEARYQTRPVLMETFVDERFQGTCYRAANWIDVGKTRGRGRQDRQRQGAVGVKKIFVLPLTEGWRAILHKGPPPLDGRERSAGPSIDWAEEEFGRVQLKDDRLKKRLMTVARDLYDRPQANIPQACQTRSKTKAAYRFFDHPNATMDTLLNSHYESTIHRLREETVVLAAQDTTSLNYTTHPETTGLGPISSRGNGVIGLKIHDTMAFNVEGTPLGLLDVQSWARDPEKAGQRHQRHQRPIEEKESHKWLTSFRRVAEAQKRCPQTMVVSVGDREADIYELFHLALQEKGGPKLLVRAERDRLLADHQGHLWEMVAGRPAEGIQEIHVPRQGKRPAREARLEVRFAEVRLKPPKRKTEWGELTVWAVLAEEIEAPEGVAPLKWMLLSTLETSTFDQATERLRWYAGRWGIEVYHRTLKSGCRVEQRQLATADRIEACLAIDMVIAWRIFHLTKLGRETPEVPCTVFFEEAEWKALSCYVRQNPVPPEKPPTLREAVRMMASLGGFLGRKGDGDPGTKSLWLGIQRLDDLTSMWKFMANNFAPHLLSVPVSSNPGYG